MLDIELSDLNTHTLLPWKKNPKTPEQDKNPQRPAGVWGERWCQLLSQRKNQKVHAAAGANGWEPSESVVLVPWWSRCAFPARLELFPRGQKGAAPPSRPPGTCSHWSWTKTKLSNSPRKAAEGLLLQPLQAQEKQRKKTNKFPPGLTKKPQTSQAKPRLHHTPGCRGTEALKKPSKGPQGSPFPRTHVKDTAIILGHKAENQGIDHHHKSPQHYGNDQLMCKHICEPFISWQSFLTMFLL